MPDPIDYARLKAILASPAGAALPANIRAKMQADIAANDQQMALTQRPDDTSALATPASQAPTPMVPPQLAPADVTVARTPVGQQQADAAHYLRGAQVASQESRPDAILAAAPKFAFQIAHDLTLGITPSGISDDPNQVGKYSQTIDPLIKVSSAITSTLMEGAGLLKGASYIGKVPIITRGLEFIPTRLKEIGIGALINGGIDALRSQPLTRDADGNVTDQSWLDPSAKIAKPLTELGVPERLALGMGGAVVGGILAPIMIGVSSGFQAGRARIAQALTPDIQESIRSGLAKAGVDVSNVGDKYQAAQAFIKNFRKMVLKGGESGVMSNQLSREQYLQNEIAVGVNNAAAPRVANTLETSPDILGEISTDPKAPGPTVEAANGQVTVAYRTTEGKPVGSLIVSDEPGQPLRAHSVVVDPGYRRQGIATKMYQAVRDQFPDRELISGASGLSTSGAALSNALTSQGIVRTMPQAAQVDGRVMAGIFRSNPGGINVVTGVESPAAIEVAQQRLGVNLHTAIIPRALDDGSATHDILIARPNYIYPNATDKGVISTLGRKINARMSTMATEAATSITAPKTTEAYILADGEPIRGGLNTNAMIEKMNLQKPVINGVERPDLALREAGRYVRLEMPEPNKLTIELPRKLTQEQFNALGRSVDAVKFDEVTIRSVDGQEQVLQNPIGGLVQDHVARMVKPSTVGSSITPKLISQFQRTGVFEGQAVVLPDGTAGSIINKAGAAGYKIRESLTGQVSVVHPKNLTILPTTLSSELQPSNLFLSALPEDQRAALAKLRYSIQQGWAQPITKYRDFEEFANTRGYMANNMRGGKIELSKINEGGAEPIKFASIKDAVEWVRNDTAPMAELSNDQVHSLLGIDRNIGYIGGGGSPPHFGELMPIDWARMEKTMLTLPTDRGVGAFQQFTKPMLPLLRDLDEKYGTQMYKAMSNYQTQQIAKQNFDRLWYSDPHGQLPNGAPSLDNIFSAKGVNWETVTHWRESNPVDRAILERTMTPAEINAGKKLGDWYNQAYSAFGIDGAFVENYMPHYREYLQKGGTDFGSFMSANGLDGLKLPKGADFISDRIRNGLLDPYNMDARQVAVQYLRMGSDNRFLKQAKDEANAMVDMINAKNPAIALPMGHMLEAMSGYEFAEQRAMLNETFQSIFDKVPGGSALDKSSLADKAVNFFSGAVYSSTMGFRPSLALRNLKDFMVMAYPLFAGPRFYEAVGRAFTAEGIAEARAAGAIGSHGGMLTESVEEFGSKLPPLLRKLTDASTMMYEDADVLTRSVTYHAAKAKAEDALTDFAARIGSAKTPAQIDLLKSNLLKDSKMYLYGPEMEDEFLRRAGTSPNAAAQFAGKQGSDMANFLYGRGMQARWMRSTAGRFLGQFGSWSMWYLDYISRLAGATLKGPNKMDALAMLGRHALVNAAIIETGRKVLNIDLSRWASYGALFYSGGPGLSIANGATTLMRGMGEVSDLNEDPLAKSRVTQGSQMIWNTLPSFVPFMFAGRDVLRMAQSYDGTDLLAATLGTKPTRAYIQQRKLDILLGRNLPPFQSTSPALGAQLNSQVVDTGQQVVDIRDVPRGGVQSSGGMQVPSAAQPGAAQTPGSRVAIPSLVPIRSGTPPTTSYRRNVGESTRPADSKPSGGY